MHVGLRLQNNDAGAGEFLLAHRGIGVGRRRSVLQVFRALLGVGEIALDLIQVQRDFAGAAALARLRGHLPLHSVPPFGHGFFVVVLAPATILQEILNEVLLALELLLLRDYLEVVLDIEGRTDVLDAVDVVMLLEVSLYFVLHTLL